MRQSPNTQHETRIKVNTTLKIQAMIRDREPGAFFGGGVLAGILVFVLWFAFLPSHRKAATDAPAGGNPAQAQHPIGANGEILSAITGGPELGQPGFIAGSPSQNESTDAGQDGGLLQDGEMPGQLEEFPGPPTGEGDAGPVEVPLEAHAEVDGVPVTEAPAELQTWYVEVLRDGNQAEVLQVNAESPEHALEIIRDYRGNPRILRGPTVQPLE